MDDLLNYRTREVIRELHERSLIPFDRTDLDYLDEAWEDEMERREESKRKRE